jgi:putative endonuclease
MQNQLQGKIGEDIALAFYRGQGFELLERNLRFRRGEIDLILRKKNLLLFVEVKFRARNWEFGADQLHWGKKMQRFRRSVSLYMAKNAPFFEEYCMEVAYVTHGRVVECYLVN